MPTRTKPPGRRLAPKRIASQPPEYALQPAFARRLVSLLEDSRLPKSSRTSYLCAETGRSKQSVHRWLNVDEPGSPDLESFALICQRFQIDANWLLGLTNTALPLPGLMVAPPGVAEPAAAYSVAVPGPTRGEAYLSFIEDLRRQSSRDNSSLEQIRMSGDEMEPRILDGALICLDTSVREIVGNGVYVLGYQGRRIVRTVEQRIGQGIALICENRKYQEVLLPDAGDLRGLGLNVIGRVLNWVQCVKA